MSSEFAANGGIHGSLTGISIGVGVSSTQKVWRSLQAFGDIAFAYSFSNILIEIQVNTIKAPPPSEAKVMKSATRLSVVTTTVFYMYMLCGCMSYALPDNLLRRRSARGEGFPWGKHHQSGIGWIPSHHPIPFHVGC
uniref:Amino acid transporter transmembrane domain-containing protein n=1 Tax=Oryza barthii TaxID=65489 RepID=A0A0D3H729_9ORYZ